MTNFTEFNRKYNCQACNFKANGVKTRKSIPHTCGIKEGFVPKNTENRGEEAKRRGYMIEPKCPDISATLDGVDVILKHVGATHTDMYLGVHFMIGGTKRPKQFISMAFAVDDRQTPLHVVLDNKGILFKEKTVDIFIKYLSEISTFYYLKEVLKYESYLDIPEIIIKNANIFKNYNVKAYLDLLKNFKLTTG